MLVEINFTGKYVVQDFCYYMMVGLQGQINNKA